MSGQLKVGFEIKALNKREFEGHGAIFGNRDLGDDIVEPGAFKRSLAEHKQAGTLPQMFWAHKSDQVPGVWTEMREDGRGLFVKGELVDTQLGNEMRTLLTKKAVRGLSIGFLTEDFTFDDDGTRHLTELKLFEVSLVSLAMNPLAQIEAVKSRLSVNGEYVPTTREFERILRNVGCSKKTAITLCSRILDDEPGGTPGDDRRDAGEVDSELSQMLKRLDDNAEKGWSAAFSNR